MAKNGTPPNLIFRASGYVKTTDMYEFPDPATLDKPLAEKDTVLARQTRFDKLVAEYEERKHITVDHALVGREERARWGFEELDIMTRDAARIEALPGFRASITQEGVEELAKFQRGVLTKHLRGINGLTIERGEGDPLLDLGDMRHEEERPTLINYLDDCNLLGQTFETIKRGNTPTAKQGER